MLPILSKHQLLHLPITSAGSGLDWWKGMARRWAQKADLTKKATLSCLLHPGQALLVHTLLHPGVCAGCPPSRRMPFHLTITLPSSFSALLKHLLP